MCYNLPFRHLVGKSLLNTEIEEKFDVFFLFLELMQGIFVVRKVESLTPIDGFV
jgi:hypothetical protein